MVNAIYLVFGFHHTRIAGSKNSDYVCVVAHGGKMENCTAVLATTSSSSSCIDNVHEHRCIAYMSSGTNKIQRIVVKNSGEMK